MRSKQLGLVSANCSITIIVLNRSDNNRSIDSIFTIISLSLLSLLLFSDLSSNSSEDDHSVDNEYNHDDDSDETEEEGEDELPLLCLTHVVPRVGRGQLLYAAHACADQHHEKQVWDVENHCWNDVVHEVDAE
jgi:hypothetical protein